MVQDGEAAAGWDMGGVGGVADTSSSSGSGGHAGAPAEEVADFRKGPWTVEEDLALVNYIAVHGEGRWNALARAAGLKRTGKSCRLRWLNYLRPDVRRGNITPEEQLLILELHSRWGNRWSKIAEHLPGRTDNEIKNYWRTRVKKHAKQLKCDANSQQFKDIVRRLWMPRLVEKIQEAAAAAAATPCTTTAASVDAVMAAEVAHPGALAGIGAEDANGSPDHPSSVVTSTDSSAETWLQPAGFADGYDGATGARGGEPGGAFPGLGSGDGGALLSDALMSPRGYLDQGLSDLGTSWWADAVGCMSPENWWAAAADDDYWFLQHAQL